MYQTCEDCPLPSECKTNAPDDDHFCPYLLLHGFNYIIGYVMVKCSVPVRMQITSCFPVTLPHLTLNSSFESVDGDKANAMYNPTAILKNMDSLRPSMNQTLLRIQQSSPSCPPNWHQREHMCFSLPQLIYTKREEFTDSCQCSHVQHRTHSIYELELVKGNPKVELQFSKPLFYRYMQSLGVSFFGDLLVFVWDPYYLSGNYHSATVAPNPYSPHLTLVGKESCTGNAYQLCSMFLGEHSVQDTACPPGYFQCDDHTCILEISRCDGQKDCLDGNDEMNCFEMCTKPRPTAACTQCTIAEGCHCSTLYFQCSGGGCISATAVCDGIVSCRDGSDEVLCTRTQQLHCDVNGRQTTNCPVSTKIKRFMQRCLYSQTDPHTSDGRHLVSCEDWQCSSMYKCYATYCIPVHYICDRVCDCPSCEDEYGCITDRDRVSVMVCLISIECVTSYGKNSNLTSFSESNSVFFRNE